MYCKRCDKEYSDLKEQCPFCGAFNINFSYEGSSAVENFNLISAYKSLFKKYIQFNGRSRRSEYWYGYLANVIIVFVWSLLVCFFMAIAIVAESISFLEVAVVMYLVMGLYSFVIIIPSLSIIVRRLHDTGKSGWMILLGLIPFAGVIIIFVFMLLDSQPGTNQYGPNPKGL